MIVILTQGYKAIIDDDDYKLICSYTWCAVVDPKSGVVYAYGNKNGIQVKLHRLIINAGVGELVDHIDNNGLNNRRNNLRITDNGTNMQRARHNLGISQYQGVRKKSGVRNKPWEARIANISVGHFATEEEAARAYDEYAIKFYGEHAYKNFL